MKYIHAKQIILADEVIENAYLEITDDGRFGQIVFEKPHENIIDYSHYILAPGLIDTHIHGFAGADVMDNDPQAIQTIAEGLLSCGVTSWLATTLTDHADNLTAVCQTIAEYTPTTPQARILGIFLEGPFFSEAHKGAQNPAYMVDPSIDIFQEWLEASKGQVTKIALAAEKEGALDFIEHVTAQGVLACQGHTDASYEEAEAGVEAGANLFIHTYNGMSGLHHRKPGVVGAALSMTSVYAEIIADGHHVHPAAIRALYRSRGPQEMLLISDSMRAGGMTEGYSKLGEFEVIVKEGTARLTSNGSLAGSILKLIDGVKNVVTWNIAPLPDAIRMASLTPAESLGLADQYGQIKAGRMADFIVLDDDIHLQATYLAGEEVYTA